MLQGSIFESKGVIGCRDSSKQINTALTAAKHLSGCHSVSLLSWQQQLTSFESRFNFPDRLKSLNTHDLMLRQKTFFRANQQQRFPRLLSSWHDAASAQCLSRQPLTAFESHFDSPDWLNTHELMQRRKTFCCANQRWLFPRLLWGLWGPALLLTCCCISTVFLCFLGNSWQHSSPASIFWPTQLI